jgi:PAS domain S-box-containing protein
MEDLDDAERAFRTLAERLPDVVARFDRDFRHLYVNGAITAKTGLGPAHYNGLTVEQLGFPADIVQKWNAALRRVVLTGEEVQILLTLVSADGSRDVEFRFFPERGADGAVVSILALTHDVTEQRAWEMKFEGSRVKLRNLAVHLLHAREEERKKVAREIHDDLGQVLTALKMDLKWIEKKLGPVSEKVTEKIQGAVQLADQTLQMVHRIASELRPGVLDDLGLSAAIEWLGADLFRRCGITCRVDVTATESRIGGDSSTVIFRVVQEALSNVALHAQAGRASVELWEADNVLNIRIRDDGRGVTPAQVASPLSLGLIGIRERVEGLGGKLSIDGQAGKGTTLVATIPLPSEGALA